MKALDRVLDDTKVHERYLPDIQMQVSLENALPE